jgi:uncharacterized protein (TIGR00645 family)
MDGGMERSIETLLLAARWLLVPLYLGLLSTVVVLYGMVGRELWHLASHMMTIGEAELVLGVLSVLDLVLVANLVVMVAISSYESFVSRIEFDGDSKPEYIGKMDAANVKLKVSLSIVMISAINLLRGFMMDGPSDRLPLMAGVHLVFITSALAIALVERVHGEKIGPAYGEKM